ncbi:hypothetical protein Tco_1559302, partial [Tanacetum coccineum]
MNDFSSIYRGWEKESESFLKLPINHSRRSFFYHFWPFDHDDEVSWPMRACHVGVCDWGGLMNEVEKRKGSGGGRI